MVEELPDAGRVTLDPIDHVRSLAEADTASATIDELKDLARPLVLGLNCKAAVIAAGTSLFRARIAGCQPFQFIGELGYPRNQVRLQRVNRPGSPMFTVAALRSPRSMNWTQA
jgi:hypothetical protein